MDNTIASLRTNDNTTHRKYDSPRKGDYSIKNSTYNNKKYNNTSNNNSNGINNGMNSNSNNCNSNNLNNNSNNTHNFNTNTLNTIDTYESVCSPEDIYERTKMAQRHTLQSNHSSSSGSSCGASTSRILKRVVSAPATESQGEIFRVYKFMFSYFSKLNANFLFQFFEIEI